MNDVAPDGRYARRYPRPLSSNLPQHFSSASEAFRRSPMTTSPALNASWLISVNTHTELTERAVTNPGALQSAADGDSVVGRHDLSPDVSSWHPLAGERCSRSW
jgi:hypothetical protein